MKYGFDEKNYLKMQTEEILKRVKKFDNKLYLEFGGKLFDDLHASRVLPGFRPHSKIEVLKKLKGKLEIIFCINANDIEKQKIRADHGITYDVEVLRLIEALTELEIPVNSIVITQYNGQPSAEKFQKKLERNKIKTYIHYYTKGYPGDVDTIVSEEGYGQNPYIETTKPIVIVTSPGAKSGKLGTCLSQLYHEHKRGLKAGYAKYETFPIWNLPLRHPINLAYEAATADLNDINMIDPFHLETYGKSAVNYNRDIEIFPVVQRMLNKIMNTSVYQSPTDMGVNMAGFCISDEDLVKKHARLEIIRRYYNALCDYKKGRVEEEVYKKLKMIMDELNITIDERSIIEKALEKSNKVNRPALAIEVTNTKIIVGRETDIMSAPASAFLNTIKYFSKVKDDIHLLSPVVLEPMIKLKKELYGEKESKLTLQDVILGLCILAPTNAVVELALSKMSKLKSLDAHSSHMMSETDERMLRSLGVCYTKEPEYYLNHIY